MKNTIFYIITITVFGSLVWGILQYGKQMEPQKVSAEVLQKEQNVSAANLPARLTSNLVANLNHPAAIMILQVLFIMIFARMFGYIMMKIGQPSVIGEIIAGIVLGPSVLGALFPSFSAFLFPVHSLPSLQVLSQVGLILFMFIVGMELDLRVLQKKVHEAVVVSHASIIFPYFLGVGLALFLYEPYAPQNITFTAFALFMGIAMSITAFPVLARIVQEKNLAQHPLGILVLTCAAADDITAWCLLAVVIAIVKAGGVVPALGTIALSLLYIGFMLGVIKPFLNKFSQKYDTPESVSKMVVAVILSILFLSCFLTEIIGIHVLFGAFMAGAVIPPNKQFIQILVEKIEDISLVLLLPIFFVFTGLRTEIGLLNETHLWSVCFLIIGVAVLGKFVGSAFAARFVGQSWRNSLIIGVLMNTRGLMELVVLNIGYDLGILSPEIFTMMVLMALVTTFMAGPALNLIEHVLPVPESEAEEVAPKTGFKTFISFGRPKAGSRLLELANGLNLSNQDSGVTAAHFSPSTDISMLEAELHEEEAFSPIKETAERLGIALKTKFKVTDHVDEEIIKSVKKERYDIMLVGSSQPLFDDDRTGGKIRNLIGQINGSVGVFIDRGFRKIQNMLIVVDEVQDFSLLKYGKQFLQGNAHTALALSDHTHSLTTQELNRTFSDENVKKRVAQVTPPADNKQFYRQYDLIILSLSYWKKLKTQPGSWLNYAPSILIISK